MMKNQALKVFISQESGVPLEIVCYIFKFNEEEQKNSTQCMLEVQYWRIQKELYKRRKRLRHVY